VLDDAVIDTQGMILGYVLSQVLVDNSLAELKCMSVDATQTQDQEVLIVKPLEKQEKSE
jgi:hypothetical protein